ncbi:MAG: tRNA1(Val) (adenine(37)-N6)-methyltransferase [Traorella sp.]
MKYTYDYLPNTNIYLYQRKDMFRMNTDTALLGQFMVIKENEKVLDIGTNNGALLLYACQYTQQTLYGVDIQKEACELAIRNLENQHISNYQIICDDIQNVQLDPVDVIICNPPYFQVQDHSHVNENEYKKIARHECYLTLDVLCQSVKRLLKDKGRFYLVHRSDRLVDLCVEFRKNDLEIKTIQLVRDCENENAHAILIEAIKGAKQHCIVKSEKIIQR